MPPLPLHQVLHCRVIMDCVAIIIVVVHASTFCLLLEYGWLACDRRG